MTTRAGTSGSAMQLADLGDEARRADRERPLQHDRAQVVLARDLHAVALGAVGVDRIRHAHGRIEIRIAQLEHEHLLVGEAARRLALDQRAVGNAAGRRHALRQRFRLALGREAGDRQRPLGHGIDLVVGAHQRRQHQRAAGQRRGIAERGDRDVDARARADEGRQLGRDDDGGDVARARLGVAHVDAHAIQHRLQRLLVNGELRRLSPVPLRPITRP